MPCFWTPKRLPGKNLECIIAHGDDFATIVAANLTSYTVRPLFKTVIRAEGRLNVTTDFTGLPEELPGHWRLMEEGPKSGLRDDPRYLSGRHHLHQAISLAVHLGFSRIRLQGPEPDPRLRRSLDSLIRPLRHKRVRVTGCAPFPME